MNDNCEFAEGGYCLCDICQVMRKAMKETGEVTQEEVNELFLDAERLLKRVEMRPEADK